MNNSRVNMIAKVGVFSAIAFFLQWIGGLMPFKVGGFKLAYRAGVPVVPTFITMTDDARLDGDGYPIQRLTLHVMERIYPDKTLGDKLGAQQMCDEAYEACKAKYEEVYGVPLKYE